MSYQPPPPPPGGTPPPPPPPGGAGPAPFDPKAVNQLDWGIMGAGALAFIFSFFDWYTVDVAGFGSGGESAWNGFFGWFAVLCAVLGAVAVAIALFAPHVKLPVPNRLAGLGLFAVATLSVILALIVFPEDVPDSSGIDTGHGFGFWAGAIVIIAGLVLSLMRFQATGGQLPGGVGKNVPNLGGYGPQGGLGGGNPPPPASGTPPPPPSNYGPPQ